jgi:hypothetical protein
MSIIIDLPRPVEARIERKAQQAGVSPAAFIVEVVTKNFAATSNTQEQKADPAVGSALVQPRIGVADRPV